MSVRLVATELGQGPPLAILHGLFGSSRNWATVAKRLAERWRVIAFDLRNHGASPWADTMSYPEMAEDVRHALAERGIERYAVLGHSMGGKAAMILALHGGASVERLVVVDIAPVPYRPHHLDLLQAMQALNLSSVHRRGEAEARLAAAIPDPGERAFLLQNLVFAEGRAHWRINLSAIGRAMPDLVGFPDLPRDARYDGPALFIAGSRSDYVLPEHEPAIRRLFPRSEIAHVENAGHWLHVEQPGAFLALVERFLA
ncbi:MAG: alpha/beta fold hydrolase [Alphaproteobacteria bacterium]|nr:alpha/beta fold hydrolase [Alphaproteobacteria bacterium]